MIKLKSRREIDLIRRGGRIVAETLQLVENQTRAGMTTTELDALIEQLIVDRGGIPAFKGYHGFPNAACISLNEERVHGIPGDRVIAEGDIVSVDVGVEIENYFADAAVTVGVGKTNGEAQKLIDVTRESLGKAIAVLGSGVRLSEIARAIQQHVESNGFSVVRQYVGHGIGRKLWEDPQVPNFWDDGADGDNCSLAKGTVIAIEPMVNAGSWKVKTLDDRWTVVTRDGRLSAHFEHTVAVTDDGCDVLTVL